MADEIEVQVPYMRYDITIPFCEGRVEIDGVKLVRSKNPGGGSAFGPDSPLATGDFGIADLNIAESGVLEHLLPTRTGQPTSNSACP